MNVTIPPTATATIYVPAGDPRLVQVSATPADAAMAPKAEGSADHWAVFTVGAGTYTSLTGRCRDSGSEAARVGQGVYVPGPCFFHNVLMKA